MRWRSSTTLSLFLTSFFALSWIVLLLSFYFQSLELFLITIVLLLLTFFTRLYLKKAGEHVELVNNRRTIKLFKGEQETLSFTLNNTGNVPIWNGQLHFSLEPILHVSNVDLVQNTKNLQFYSIPYYLGRKEGKTISFPIYADKRGVTRIRKVELLIKDLFGWGRQLSILESLFQTEILIYPELLEVKGVERLSTFEMGSHSYEHSLYENLSSPAGSREYESSDPFNRIHWKATARTSELKTKVYERSIDLRWIFVLDLSVKRKNSPGQVSKDIETYISQLAFLCELATKRGVSFELHINLDPEGPSPCMTLEAGEGNAQLSNALELLARIDETRPLLSFERMSAWLRKRITDRSVVIRLGEPIQESKEAAFYHLLERKGHKCYEVKMSGDDAYLSHLERKKES
ncbi:DUF58 domain-containing protein [Guptibacillus hwajinpoensis]|uniref:DUF58 domain-containing protein n=1 Tax=Guptibacillus hwajinpoensis TaxID=208199 RepID=UPI00273DAAD6|nr:DUF58 domain-containing protein [Pseudalkalibacillus hwajinpoensis]WLR60431.1 DUF58 domain-containing protein [Pseudalkalibacillus hwajinpoensis]